MEQNEILHFMEFIIDTRLVLIIKATNKAQIFVTFLLFFNGLFSMIV